MREHIFDSPFWGTPDLEFHRLERWRQLTKKRNPQAKSFEVLNADFPLLADPEILLQYQALPAFSAQSHESAWQWLELFPAETGVINLDSHHDLYSQSGDGSRVRPGNWAGLALQRGRISSYTCIYPEWHAGVRVTEGYDLERTKDEIIQAIGSEILGKVFLERGELPRSLQVSSLLIVQSPAWTNPYYDFLLTDILAQLQTQALTPTLKRP